MGTFFRMLGRGSYALHVYVRQHLLVVSCQPHDMFLVPMCSQLKPHAASAIAEYTRNPAFYQVDNAIHHNRSSCCAMFLNHVFDFASCTYPPFCEIVNDHSPLL